MSETAPSIRREIDPQDPTVVTVGNGRMDEYLAAKKVDGKVRSLHSQLWAADTEKLLLPAPKALQHRRWTL